MENFKKMNASGNTPHCSVTVFVANLPFSFTNTQLEETFSEVGPIRRFFMVTKNGSSVHRGFGFVQFAAVEDSNRAIEMKNGLTIGGRKIGVKHAMHRAPLEQRRAKENKVHAEDVVKTNKDVLATKVEKLEKAPNSHLEVHMEDVVERKKDKIVEGKSMKKRKRTVISHCLPDERSATEKQRIIQHREGIKMSAASYFQRIFSTEPVSFTREDLDIIREEDNQQLNTTPTINEIIEESCG